MSTRPPQPVGLTLTSLMRWMSQQQLDTGTTVSSRKVRATELRLVERQSSPGSVARTGSNRGDKTSG